MTDDLLARKTGYIPNTKFQNKVYASCPVGLLLYKKARRHQSV